MELSAALDADLSVLTDVLDEPGSAPLGSVLRRLVRDTRLAIPSFLGLTLRLFVDGAPVTLTALQDDADPSTAVTSAQLPLTALSEAEPGSTIAFYATRPGAFVDFVADVSFALGLHPGEIVLDGDLDPPPSNVGAPLPGLTDRSQINQAIGILIDHGLTPEDADRELRRRALEQNLPLREAARRLIDMTVTVTGGS